MPKTTEYYWWIGRPQVKDSFDVYSVKYTKEEGQQVISHYLNDKGNWIKYEENQIIESCCSIPGYMALTFYHNPFPLDDGDIEMAIGNLVSNLLNNLEGTSSIQRVM